MKTLKLYFVSFIKNKTHFKTSLFLLFLTVSPALFSQVAINATGALPAPSAGLDVNYSNKGILIPRVALTSLTDVTTINSPAQYMMVFNTNTNCLEYFTGTVWQNVTCTCTGTPATPGAITGNTTPCASSAGNVYSIAPVATAFYYTWTVPAGDTITAGQGTTSITVTFGSTSGNISVTESNNCGTSTASTLPVTIPANHGSISFTYLASVQTWTVPACVTQITISAIGASGGSTGTLYGGLGVSISGQCAVTGGDVIDVVTGGIGGSIGTNAKGGGGGTFIWINNSNTLLVAAGGGGGSCGYQVNQNNASTTTTPNPSTGGGTGEGGGASNGSPWDGGGGAGFLGNGQSCTIGYFAGGGQDMANGFAGGAAGSGWGSPGGYGGGGAGGYSVGGGGGGYNGGAPGNSDGDPGGTGAGGGSYVNGTIIGTPSATNTGNGSVTIQY